MSPARGKFAVPKPPWCNEKGHETGEVTVGVPADYDGKVKNTHVMVGDPVLGDVAKNEVQQWLFRPFILNGASAELTAQRTEPLELVIDFLHQANLESVAPLRYLAGGDRRRILKPRLCRTYRTHSLSDLPLSIRNEPDEVRGVARIASKDRAHRRLLHTECSSVSLLACHVSAA